MAAKISELELVQRIRLPEQQLLTRVWYEQNRDTAPFDCHDYHSIERAVYFETATGNKFKIEWADELGIYHGFGISLKAISAIATQGGQLTEVTPHKDWQAYKDQLVKSVHVHWQQVAGNMRTRLLPLFGINHLRRTDYPQTLELLFNNGARLFISVLKVESGRQSIPFTNHLSIFFNKQQLDDYYQPVRTW